MEYELSFITSWLMDGSCHTADILTVLGMGGIGKTSLAKYVFGSHSRAFNKSSFLRDISRRCADQFYGLLDVHKQLYGDISNKIPLHVHDVSEYTSMIGNALAGKKVFLVLDDIDSLEQLDALLGSKGFHPGSKIIITTKDASLTEKCDLFNPKVQSKHTTVLLKGLYHAQSLELLCLHAFKSQKPKEGYIKVSEKLVEYCQGHPLALEVLGKSLRNTDVAEWEDCIEGLKKEPHSRIKKALRLSFDSLPSENDMGLFKYIACFFVGQERDFTETILKACNINMRRGITNLIDRSLLWIGWNNKLMMHSLIQEMGRDLVYQESPNKPGKRSRLCCHEESFKVLKEEKGKGNLLGLTLDMRMLDKNKIPGSFKLKTDSFSKMDNLMLLQLNYVQLKGSYENFPEELRWLCMHGFPSKFVPSELPMEYLVALDLSRSNIESFDLSYYNLQQPSKRRKLLGSFSKDKGLLGSLKILNLSFCYRLCSVSGFSQLPTLERLILISCTRLIEISDSIELCIELVLIDLTNCYNLKKLPRSISTLKKLKSLVLDGCNFNKSRMEALSRDSKSLMFSLPRSLVRLSLANCNLCHESFPMDFSSLSMLKDLRLDGNPIASLPSAVRSLPRLDILSLNHCKMLKSIEHPPSTLRQLFLRPSSWPDNIKHLLQKIVFDPKMSPLSIFVPLHLLAPSSIEIEGMVKIQPMAGVDETILHSLGWTDVKFIKKMRLKTDHMVRGSEESKIQMYYEFGILSTIYAGNEMPNWFSLGNKEPSKMSNWISRGNKGPSISFTIPSSPNLGIFSTIYEGNEMPNWFILVNKEPSKMPNWISHGNKGPSISFTIPSSPNQLRGLNFCYVMTFRTPNGMLRLARDQLLELPWITISNTTKNHTWIYHHFVGSVSVPAMHLTLLSHWMFGMNEMEAGDQITVTVIEKKGHFTTECGVSFVYDDGKMEEEDVLGYYKSWNHIIGGDLSAFQLTTGEYLLSNLRFTNLQIASYKEEEVYFRAFSQRKTGMQLTPKSFS